MSQVKNLTNNRETTEAEKTIILLFQPSSIDQLQLGNSLARLRNTNVYHALCSMQYAKYFYMLSAFDANKISCESANMMVTMPTANWKIPMR